MLAIVIAALLQQAAAAPVSGQVVWETPAPDQPAVAAAPVEVPPIPESARTDPYGYERAQCSPLVRDARETLEACQTRVRAVLAANLGDALPRGLMPPGTPDTCRQEAAGDRYALQCGAPSRAGPATSSLVEQTCETRPQAQPQGGGVAWTEECRPADGSRPAEDGLRIRLGGED